jgi:hypothetical protein
MLGITFSINGNNVLLATYYVTAIFPLVLMQAELPHVLNRSQKSVYLSWMSNVTSDLYCGIPYDDCRCFLVSTEDCLSNRQVKTARILPLVLFVLEILLIGELFSLNGSYKYFFVYLLWITSMFVFISVVVIVHRKFCYYSNMALILCCTGCSLFSVVCFTVTNHRRRSFVE